MWGFMVLCIGFLGSAYEGLSMFTDASHVAYLRAKHGLAAEHLQDVMSGDLRVIISTCLLIGWLVVSCLGGLLYRYARLSL